MKDFIYHDSLAEIVKKPTPLPEIKLVERNENSIPFNAADRQQAPVILSDYGYLEEEYFVSGYANIYEYYDEGLYPKIRAENGAYKTRILVRRPEDMSRFSGFAVVELMNYAGPCEKPQAGWGNCCFRYMADGDVWVGVTAKQSAINSLKKYDPARYNELGFPNPVAPEKRRYVRQVMGRTDPDAENGLFYDAFSQIAALLKSPVGNNPLNTAGMFGRAAKYAIATGASGCDLSLYAAALHPFATMDGEAPVYDGYLIHMTGYPGQISNGETRFDAADDRCKIYTNVPLIWTQTMSDMIGGGIHPSYSYMYRRPDSDLPGRQFRHYEIAASPITSNFDRRVIPCMEDIERSGGNTKDPLYEPGNDFDDFPTRYVIRAAAYHLKRWIKYGLPAPRSNYLEMTGEYPDAVFVLDEYGNPKGGIRSPFVDVPTQTYTIEEPLQVKNIIKPFSKELLKRLYPTREDYIKKVTAAAIDMLEKGFILPEDAKEIINLAYEAKIPE